MSRKVYEHSVYWDTIKSLERKELAAFAPSEVDRCWRLICARDFRRNIETELHQRKITSEGVYTEHGRIFAAQQRKTFAENPDKGRYLKKCDIMEEDAAQMVYYFQTLCDDVKERVARLNPVYRKLRQIQRSKYYEAETRRRRELAAERRKQDRKQTLNDMPTVAQIREAWNRRKESKERIILLGSLLLDLDCYLARSFCIDEHGVVLGRRGGIHEWIRRNLPDLEPHYKSLMSYKALAKKLRQAAELRDPFPVDRLLKENPLRPVMKEIESLPKANFLSLMVFLDRRLSPEKVMDDLLGKSVGASKKEPVASALAQTRRRAPEGRRKGA